MQMRRHCIRDLGTAIKHAILSLMLLCTWHYFICMILRTLTRHFGTDEPSKLKLECLPRRIIWKSPQSQVRELSNYTNLFVSEYVRTHVRSNWEMTLPRWKEEKISTPKMLRPGYVPPFFSEVRKSTRKFRSKLKTTSYFGRKEPGGRPNVDSMKFKRRIKVKWT